MTNDLDTPLVMGNIAKWQFLLCWTARHSDLMIPENKLSSQCRSTETNRLVLNAKITSRSCPYRQNTTSFNTAWITHSDRVLVRTSGMPVITTIYHRGNLLCFESLWNTSKLPLRVTAVHLGTLTRKTPTEVHSQLFRIIASVRADNGDKKGHF